MNTRERIVLWKAPILKRIKRLRIKAVFTGLRYTNFEGPNDFRPSQYAMPSMRNAIFVKSIVTSRSVSQICTCGIRFSMTITKKPKCKR